MKLGIFLITALTTLSLHAKTWGGEELADSLDAAQSEFIKDLGQKVFEQNVTQMQVKRGTTKVEANVRITYTDGNQSKEEKYYCHQHGAHIDCH